MLKKRDLQRIESKEREWDLAIRDAKRKFIKFWNRFKLEVKKEKDNMIYGKKPKERLEQWWYEGVWWVKIIIIFFALKGLFGGG